MAISAQGPEQIKTLPRGSHGLPHEFVVRSQRERLFAGLARVMARDGYAATTVDEIAGESHVSRKALYTHFSGKDSLLLQAHQAIVERITAGAGPAVAEQDEWKAALRALLDWGLEFFANEPTFAHLALVEMSAATPSSRELLSDSLKPVRDLLERAATESSREASPVMIDAMLGGVIYVIVKAIDDGDHGELPLLRPQLMAWFVLMLEGPRAASTELAREVAVTTSRAEPARSEAGG